MTHRTGSRGRRVFGNVQRQHVDSHHDGMCRVRPEVEAEDMDR